MQWLQGGNRNTNSRRKVSEIESDIRSVASSGNFAGKAHDIAERLGELAAAVAAPSAEFVSLLKRLVEALDEKNKAHRQVVIKAFHLIERVALAYGLGREDVDFLEHQVQFGGPRLMNAFRCLTASVLGGSPDASNEAKAALERSSETCLANPGKGGKTGWHYDLSDKAGSSTNREANACVIPSLRAPLTSSRRLEGFGHGRLRGMRKDILLQALSSSDGAASAEAIAMFEAQARSRPAEVSSLLSDGIREATKHLQARNPKGSRPKGVLGGRELNVESPFCRESLARLCGRIVHSGSSSDGPTAMAFRRALAWLTLDSCRHVALSAIRSLCADPSLLGSSYDTSKAASEAFVQLSQEDAPSSPDGKRTAKSGLEHLAHLLTEFIRESELPIVAEACLGARALGTARKHAIASGRCMKDDGTAEIEPLAQTLSWRMSGDQRWPPSLRGRAHEAMILLHPHSGMEDPGAAFLSWMQSPGNKDQSSLSRTLNSLAVALRIAPAEHASHVQVVLTSLKSKPEWFGPEPLEEVLRAASLNGDDMARRAFTSVGNLVFDLMHPRYGFDAPSDEQVKLLTMAVSYIGEYANFVCAEYAWEWREALPRKGDVREGRELTDAAAAINPLMLSIIYTIECASAAGSWEVRLAASVAMEKLAIRSGEPFRFLCREGLRRMLFRKSGVAHAAFSALKFIEAIYASQLEFEQLSHDSSDAVLPWVASRHRILLNALCTRCRLPKSLYLPLGPGSRSFVQRAKEAFGEEALTAERDGDSRDVIMLLARTPAQRDFGASVSFHRHAPFQSETPPIVDPFAEFSEARRTEPAPVTGGQEEIPTSTVEQDTMPGVNELLTTPLPPGGYPHESEQPQRVHPTPYPWHDGSERGSQEDNILQALEDGFQDIVFDAPHSHTVAEGEGASHRINREPGLPPETGGTTESREDGIRLGSSSQPGMSEESEDSIGGMLPEISTSWYVGAATYDPPETASNQLRVTEGEPLEVVERGEEWAYCRNFFMEEGWVPWSYLVEAPGN